MKKDKDTNVKFLLDWLQTGEYAQIGMFDFLDSGFYWTIHLLRKKIEIATVKVKGELYARYYAKEGYNKIPTDAKIMRVNPQDHAAAELRETLRKRAARQKDADGQQVIEWADVLAAASGGTAL